MLLLLGESLFADVSGVRGLNGIPGSFVYQWVRVDGGVEENISGSGATLAIYNVVSADEGKLLKVKVSFIDGSGFSEGPLASDSTGAVLDAAPIVPHGTRLSAAITLPSSFGSHASQSIWFDGITLYVLNYNLDRRIYAYTLSNGSRDRSKEFSDVGSFVPKSIWSDGETMWVSDDFSDKIYAYKMSDKSRDSGKDFNTLNATGNKKPLGIWSDGVTMWVSDLVDDKIYAYRMSDKSRDSGKDFDTLVAAGNTNPGGIWSDGVTMWVADIASNPPVSKLFAYNMSDKSRDSGKDLNLTVTFPGSLTGPGLNGRTMLLGRENEVHFYAVDSVYKLPRWSEDSGKDCGGDVSTGCSVDVNGYAVGVIDPAADVDWWSLELEGGKTYAIDVKGAGDQSGNDNAGTLPNPAVVLRSSVGGNLVVVVGNDDVDGGQNNNSRVVYLVGLDEGGTYYVSVAKASNSFEGGTYTVFVEDSNSLPVNSDPVFSSSSSFSVNENSLSVGTVVASDGDSLDSVTGYSISGGLDRARFSITNAGVLTFVSAPDYEAPVDVGGNNVYDLVVTVTSGTGGRVRNATQSISVTVDDVDEGGSNSLPVFSSSSSFSVNENLLSVGVVVASDSDGQDGVVGYVVSGGADSERFTINNGGVLSFVSVPNYESPVDVGGNNVYNLVVEATSGTGGRVNTATQTITVTVTDVDEVPSTPSVPVLSSPSSNSLSVSWSAPGNTGPAISDYDVGYGLNSNGPFTDWPHSGASRSATITGLNASTLYYVRVLARNAEGDSGWSETASFTTGSAVTNSDPVFSSSSSFSVNENIRVVGVVVASDSDGQDSVTGYSISGGVDRARFSITNGDVLSFVSVPDFEVPVDVGGNNVYDLVVTVTSGTGSRVRTATQSITVTVDDVAEGGSNSLPVFSSNSSFSVNENVRVVGVVVASDGDSLDSVTGYRVSGGVDSALFSITDGGVLTFRSAPDYEVPVDVGGNNVYDLVVTVTSGTGSRVKTAVQTITVTVVDVDEAPSAPGSPVLSSPSSTSLSVSWSAPGGTGPSISDYDVGYGLNSGGPFTDWPHSGASRSATLTGLNASTLYYVRVLARNAEGNSSWSETASFTTGSVVVNSDPVFTSSSSFSVNENVRVVGVVVASDSDGQDGVSGYSVSGGVDSARFSITNGGVLSFVSVPDFESPVDVGGNNVYDLVVTITSGTGGRVRTASQSISVTVNDVGEGPVIPPKEVVSVYNCG